MQQALAHKQDYEFQAHGVELNHRYTSAAVVPAGLPPAPSPLDPELYYLPTTSPGARLPHAWAQQQNQALSTLDLVGQGRFTVLTGIGGEAWLAAAASAATHFGLPVAAHLIGTGGAITDPYGIWAALRETAEAGYSCGPMATSAGAPTVPPKAPPPLLLRYSGHSASS